MPFFIVTMVHPDGPAWGEHVAAHVRYLEKLVRGAPCAHPARCGERRSARAS